MVRDLYDIEETIKAAVEADLPTLVDVISQAFQEAKAPVSEWVV
jgi:hypothetical protein